MDRSFQPILSQLTPGCGELYAAIEEVISHCVSVQVALRLAQVRHFSSFVEVLKDLESAKEKGAKALPRARIKRQEPFEHLGCSYRTACDAVLALAERIEETIARRGMRAWQDGWRSTGLRGRSMVIDGQVFAVEVDGRFDCPRASELVADLAPEHWPDFARQVYSLLPAWDEQELLIAAQVEIGNAELPSAPPLALTWKSDQTATVTGSDAPALPDLSSEPEHAGTAGAQQPTIELIPGGFVYRGKQHELTGRPRDMLKALLQAPYFRRTASDLCKDMGVDDEAVTFPEQVVRDTAKESRAALRHAVQAVGLSCDNPLPSGGRGKDLYYRLALP